MDRQLCNNYTPIEYILSDLPILGDFFRMGLFFLAGSFSVLLPLSTFTWQIHRRGMMNKQADWNQRFCASLLFQAEFVSKWKVWQTKYGLYLSCNLTK